METLRILVVDDEPGLRRGVARALRGFTIGPAEEGLEAQFAIDLVESGEAALEKIGVAAPDILLLDLKLPGIQGLDVLDRVTREHREVLTIIITAYASLETAVAATKRGAYDFLAKPFTPEELKSTVAKAARQAVVQREARRLAREKKQLRFQLISVVSHELKAPLAAIEGYLRLIKDKTAGDDPAAYDHMLDRSIVRLEGMRKLIFDLLDLTRIESGQKKRNLAEVDLAAVARGALETVAPAASERRVTVEARLPDKLPLLGDAGELEIILNNLLSNAVKYNREDGKVALSLEREEGGLVRLVCSDTGIGLTAEECSRLFGEFVRIKNSKTENIQGSGLGLSIVKRLAQLYGGSAGVASSPDVGSTFTVTLRENYRPPAEDKNQPGGAPSDR